MDPAVFCSSADSVTVGASQYPQSEAEWESHKELIRTLYLVQDKSIPEVRRILEQRHHFKATLKMYKTRLQKWDFGKYIKKDELSDIINATQSRDAIGKASNVMVRGKVIDRNRLRQLAKRKRMDADCLIAAQSNRTQSIFVRTPSPSLRSAMVFRDLAVAHQLLVALRCYLDSTLAEGIWDRSLSGSAQSSEKEASALRSLNILNFELVQTCRLLHDKEFNQAKQVFKCGLARVRGILDSEYPRAYLHILCFPVSLARSGRNHVASILVHQFSRIAETVLEPNNPFRRLWYLLGRLPRHQFADVIPRASLAITDIFTYSQGTNGPDVIYCHSLYLRILRDNGNIEEADKFLKHLLSVTTEPCQLQAGLAENLFRAMSLRRL